METNAQGILDLFIITNVEAILQGVEGFFLVFGVWSSDKEIVNIECNDGAS